MSPIALVQPHRDRKQLQELSPTDAQAKLITMWLHKKAPSSVAAYQRYITKFFASVAKPLKAVTLEDLYDFSTQLSEEELAPNTQKIYLSAIKSLISFAHKIGFIPFNVGSAMKLEKIPDRLTERHLYKKEIQRIIDATEQFQYRYQKDKQRDLLIIKLLYTSALRVSELVKLTWKDFEPRGNGTGQINVLGKGNKKRSILLPQWLWAELMEFRAEATDSNAVFTSRGGGRGKALAGGHLDRSQINRIVEKATQRAGIDKKVSPHWLRHAHATHALKSGADIGLVKQTLGHDNVSTTSRYLDVVPDDSSAMHISAL